MQQFGLSKVKNRQLPYLSQECESHWINHCQDMHKRNLKRVKPAIDNKWGGKKNGVTDPKMPKYPHLSSNAARARREDERWREVEKENQHLLSKMARIMRSVPFNESREFLPGIRLNPGNEPRMDTQIADVTYSRGAASYTVKRNQTVVNKMIRDQQLRKITDENMALVRRLQATQPAYPVDKLEADRRQTEILLKSICHYPYQGGTWAKERRQKAAADKLGASGSAAAADIGLLELRPDDSGVITFEIVAAEYSLPAREYHVPLSGSLPLMIDMGAIASGSAAQSSVLALSSTAPAAGASGALTVHPRAGKQRSKPANKKGTPKKGASARV